MIDDCIDHAHIYAHDGRETVDAARSEYQAHRGPLEREGWERVGGTKHEKSRKETFSSWCHGTAPYPLTSPDRSRKLQGGSGAAKVQTQTTCPTLGTGIPRSRAPRELQTQNERKGETLRLIAVVDRAEDGYFGVAFPDAPGCVAMGATQDEAIANATDALAEWAADVRSAGRSVSAHTVEEILADPDVREAMGTGGFLVSIPMLENRGKLARANISLDEGLLASIDATARRLGVTRSAFMAAASLEKIKTTA